MYCRKCGKKLSEHAKFCSGCGAKMEASPGKNDSKQKLEPKVPAHQEPPDPKRAERNPLFIVFGLFLMALIVVILGMMAFSSGAFNAFLDKTEMKTEASKERETNKDKETMSEEKNAEEETTEPALDSKKPEPESTAFGTEPVSISGDDYILPESSIRLITAADLIGMTKEQLRYARNEIYARHGRTFKDQALQEYFNKMSWYQARVTADDFFEDMLSQLEKDNVKYIQLTEDSRQ